MKNAMLELLAYPRYISLQFVTRERGMSERFEVTGFRGVMEPEPGIVEIALELGDHPPSVLRMSLLTFLNLWAGMKGLASPSEPFTDDTDASADASA